MRLSPRSGILVLFLLRPGWVAGAVFDWQPAAKMPLGRGGQVCGVVNGKVLHAGGTYWIDGKQKMWSNLLDIYDPVSNRWSRGPDLPLPLSYGGGGAVGGKLYIVSGSDGRRDYTDCVVIVPRGESYDFAQGPAVPTPRLYCSTVVVGSKLYLIGGAQDRDCALPFYRDAIVLDTTRPEQGWTRLRPMPGAGRCLTGAAALGQHIYVFGGYLHVGKGFANSAEAFVYDIARDRWRHLPDAPYASRGWDAVAMGGSVFILGGYVTWPPASGRPESFTDNIITFDPHRRTYELVDKMPYEACGVNPVVLPDRRLMIAGGEDRMKHRTDQAALATLRRR